jgi:O-antigen/teichoic acid export membrane protein
MSESESSLDRSLVTGIGWTAFFRWAAQIVSWGGTLYAARILAPADYGVIAMAMVPIGLVRMIEDFGFDAVLLQNRELSDMQVARLGGLALLFGTVLTVSIAAFSPLIAQFYGEPSVAPVILALSVLVVLDAMQIVPRVLLQRDLEFFWLGAVYLAQAVAIAVTLVLLAHYGAGLWALVFNTLSGAAFATLLLFMLRPFRPHWPRDLAGLRGPIVSGWRMLVSRAAYYANSTADQTIAGRVLGKDALGHYSFAMSIASLPVQEITSLVSRVVPGVFSAAQTDRALLRRYFLLLTEVLTYLAFPVTCGLALTAPHVVPIALGPQWDAVIVPLQGLSLYMAMYAAQTLVSHVLLWTGHFRHMMWFSLLSLVVLSAAFLIGMRSAGLPGLAWAWSFAYPLATLPAMIVAWRILRLRWMEFFNALLPAAVACAVMSAVVLLVRAAMGSGASHIAALAVEASVGAVVYVMVMGFVFRARLVGLIEFVRSTRSLARSEPSEQPA